MDLKKFAHVLISVIIFFMGMYAGVIICEFTHKPTLESDSEVKTEIRYYDRVTHEIEYRERLNGENEDIEFDVGKQDLTISVNGEKQTIQKAENEKYIFDKNKLVYTQTSTTDLNIKIPTIDKTKRFGVGVGYYDKEAIGIVKAPITNSVKAFAIGNKHRFGGGVILEF